MSFTAIKDPKLYLKQKFDASSLPADVQPLQLVQQEIVPSTKNSLFFVVLFSRTFLLRAEYNIHKSSKRVEF